MPGFKATEIHVEFVVENWQGGWFTSKHLRFPVQIIIPQTNSVLLSLGSGTIAPIWGRSSEGLNFTSLPSTQI
jgi:hypothetical protein